MSTTDIRTILSAEKLKSVLSAMSGPLGFTLSFLPIDADNGSPAAIALPDFGLAVTASGPAARRAEIEAVVLRVAGEIADQEREASSLTEEIMLRYEQLSLLFGMSERLGGARDNPSRMRAILDTAAEAVGAAQGCLTVNGHDVRLDGPDDDDGPALRDLARQAVEQMKPLVDERRHLALPLSTDGVTVMGGLALGPKRSGCYRSGDLKLLGTLAAYSSLLLESGRLYEDLEHLFFNTVQSMVGAVDAKDPRTAGHSQRVRRISARIAERLGMLPPEVKRLELAALLHDVGKIGLPDQILNNVEPRLTPEQWALVKQHPQIGVSILSHVNQLTDILPAIGQHHERFDGTGYPNGMRGNDIFRYARIIAVADSFDAMTMERTYRPTFTREQAVAEIRDNAGTQFDPEIARTFVNCDHCSDAR
ncbi:MAG: HD-GYP domain-containing protein [Candidatus Edwardsbacteria bacterium]|jgi:putative nucleotidyltransferase with HDIG domain|nr:HD-GYP domain-containing protein [Candidatus Edwardsbacteria bacterium]